jgi:hypothetical protein
MLLDPGQHSPRRLFSRQSVVRASKDVVEIVDARHRSMHLIRFSLVHQHHTPSDPQPPNLTTRRRKTDIPTLLSADILALLLHALLQPS